MPAETHLYEEDFDRAVDVAPGITMLHYPSTSIRPGWAVRHACPGIWRESTDAPRMVVAPMVSHDVVSEDPLTITPSILCQGAGLPCGLHGYVTAGRWKDTGTPPETMAWVRGEVTRG